MEYYAAIKKNKTMSFTATWIEPEAIMLSEVTQELAEPQDKGLINEGLGRWTVGRNSPAPDVENQILYFLTYKWELSYGYTKAYRVI